MICQNCGANLKEGVLFCRECGYKVVHMQKKFCRECGEKIIQGAKFCEFCGADLINTCKAPSPNITSSYQAIQESIVKENYNNDETDLYETDDYECYEEDDEQGFYDVDDEFDDNDIDSIYSTSEFDNSSTNLSPDDIYTSLKTDSLRRKQAEKKHNLVPAILSVICIIFTLIGVYISRSNYVLKNDSSTTGSPEAEYTSLAYTSAKPYKNGFNQTTNYRFGNYLISIPNYWNMQILNDNSYIGHAESDENASMIQLICTYDDTAPVTIETLTENINTGGLIQAFSATIDQYGTYGDVKIQKYDKDDIQGFMLSTEAYIQNEKEYIACLTLPSYEDNCWIVIWFNQTENSKFDYMNDYMRILQSIKKVDEKDLYHNPHYPSIEY